MAPVHAKHQHAQEISVYPLDLRMNHSKAVNSGANRLEGLTVFPSTWSPQRQFFTQFSIKTRHYPLDCIACAVA